MDSLLTGLQQQLVSSTPADVSLLLATIARSGHVAPYAWSEVVVEGFCRQQAASFTPKELATVCWALARMHHQASEELQAELMAAAEVALVSSTADNIATLVWSLTQLSSPGPKVAALLAAVCRRTRWRLAEFAPRDLVSLLAALASFEHRPPEDWLTELVGCLDAHLPFIDARGHVEVLAALASMQVQVSDSGWWARVCDQMAPLLPLMDAQSLESVALALVTLRHLPNASFRQQYAAAVDGLFNPTQPAQPLAGAPLPRPALPSPPTAAAAEGLLAAVLALGLTPSPQQVAGTEAACAGLAALESMGTRRLLGLVASLAEVAERCPGGLPRTSWLAGPLAIALRAALPRCHLIQQAELARSLGRLCAAMGAADDARDGVTAATAARGAPASLRDLLSYLREYFLYNG